MQKKRRGEIQNKRTREKFRMWAFQSSDSWLWEGQKEITTAITTTTRVKAIIASPGDLLTILERQNLKFMKLRNVRGRILWL